MHQLANKSSILPPPKKVTDPFFGLNCIITSRILYAIFVVHVLVFGFVTNANSQYISVTQSTVSIAENGETYDQGINLSTMPSGIVTVTLQVEDENIATINKKSLTFTPQNYNTRQTVTITGVDDAVSNTNGRRRTTITLTASGADYEGITATITVSTIDDDLRLVSDRLDEGKSLLL